MAYDFIVVQPDSIERITVLPSPLDYPVGTFIFNISQNTWYVSPNDCGLTRWESVELAKMPEEVINRKSLFTMVMP